MPAVELINFVDPNKILFERVPTGDKYVFVVKGNVAYRVPFNGKPSRVILLFKIY